MGGWHEDVFAANEEQHGDAGRDERFGRHAFAERSSHGVTIHQVEAGHLEVGLRYGFVLVARPLAEHALELAEAFARFAMSGNLTHESVRELEADDGVCEHQPFHAFGVGGGEPYARASAHRLRNQRDAIESKVVEQRAQILHEPRSPRAAGVARVAEAAVVKHDDLMALGEKRDLVEPVRMVSADPMGEHQRPSLPVDFVIEMKAVDLNRRHKASFPRYQE
jgi:hypothetical protein